MHTPPPPRKRRRPRRRGEPVFLPPEGPPRARDASHEEARLAPTVHLRPYQLEGAAWLAARQSGILADEPGVGKGHPLTTQILTPYGWRQLRWINPGDEVIGSDGRPTRVEDVHLRGALPVYRVTFNDGASVLVDDDHLWAVKSKNDVNRCASWRLMDTRKLRSKDPQDQTWRWRIPMVEAVQFAQRPRLPLDPYLLGVLIADGCLSSENSVRFCPGDERVPREVAKVLPRGFTLKKSGGGRAQRWAIVNAERGRKNRVLDALRELGLHGTKSHERFVPNQYLIASVEDRVSLLQGLMDTDGEARPSGLLQYCTTSGVLADDVSFLVEALGGVARRSVKRHPRYTHNGEERVGRPAYLVTIHLPEWVTPLRAFADRFKPRTKYRTPTRIIDRIEFEEVAQVACLKVAAKDQLYVTEHCLVTHNTPQATAAIPPGAPVLIICPSVARDGVWPAHVAWRPDLRSRINRRRADFVWPVPGEAVVITYPGLPTWLEKGQAHWVGSPPEGLCVLLDEGHLAKNPEAKQSKRAKAVCEWARAHGGVTWVLTGHPLKNHPIDLWHLLVLLGLAEATWRTKSRFCRAFGINPYTGEVVGDVEPTVPEVLRRVMLRREFADVVEDMPERQWVDLRVEIDEDTSGVADAVVEALAESGIDLESATRSVLADQRNNAVHGEFMRVRALLAAAKVPALLELVEAHHAESDRPLVVFSAHRAPLEAVCARFEGWERVSGSESPSRRAELAAAFQAGELRGLAVTIGPVSTAISLSAARRAIFVDLGWTPSDNEQAEGRIFRADERTIGTTDPVIYTVLVADHPVDRTLHRILKTKRDTTAASVGAASVRVGQVPDMAPVAPSQESRGPEPDAPPGKPARPAAPTATPRATRGQSSRPAAAPVEFWAEESLGVLAASDAVSAFERPFFVRVSREIEQGLDDHTWRALVKACRRHVSNLSPPPSAA